MARVLTPEQIVQAIEDQGGMVGVTKAAGLLKIKPPNFKRDAAPKLTQLPVDGSASVYFRSEVEQLSEELEAARAAKVNGNA